MYDLSNESFFEKLCGTYATGKPINSIPANLSLQISIRDYLERLLNTRKGTLEHLPGYGLLNIPDYIHPTPRGACILQLELQNLITKYEPRLKKVKVELDATDHQLDFSLFVISGEIFNQQLVFFNIIFDSSQIIKVHYIK